MPRYAIEFVASADKALRRLPVAMPRRIVTAVEGLAEDPRPTGCVKLSDADNAWRIRVGDYRVLYDIQDRRLVVLVIRIGHRNEK